MPRGRAYRFVETPTGQTSTTTRDFQRTVRSHAARASHTGRGPRRRLFTRGQNVGQGVIVFDAEATDPAIDHNPRFSPAVARTGELAIASRRGRSDHGHRVSGPSGLGSPYRLTTNYLSGDTFSPLRHLPTYHQPYLPGIINHYIYNLTIPVPELDGNSTEPMFQAVWLPVVFHDPVVFQVVVLFAATHYAMYANPDETNNLYQELLSLKQLALLALIQAVQRQQTVSSSPTSRARDSQDTLIAAAAKMASYEAIFGTGEAFHLHMSSVTRLLRLRGGLTTPGMNGFLPRLLSFVDINSAFLLGTNLYLGEFGLSNPVALHRPFQQRLSDVVVPQALVQTRNINTVNLERFIGLMNTGGESDQGSERP